MPPILALFICTGFVVYLLRLERRQAPDVSRSLWIPTIWILYVASKPLSIWFPFSGATGESSPLDRAFLIALLIWATAILMRRHFPLFRAARAHAWLMVLLGYMLFSLFWSVIPGTAFVRLVREFQAVLMAFVVLSEPFPRKAMESIFRRMIYILIPYSLMLVKFFPELGREYARWSGEEMWIGVALQKNGLGRLCILTLFFFLWTWVKRRQKQEPPVCKKLLPMEIFLAAVTVYLMRGPGGRAYSATAIGALAAGLLVYAGLHFIRKRNQPIGSFILTALVVLIIMTGVVTIFTQGSAVGSMASTLGRNSTLTDRTAVWKALVPVAMRHPLLGNGFGSFWVPGTREFFKISEGHSGYLDVLLDLGFVGIFLVSMFLLSSCRKAHREMSQDYDWAVLWICCLIMSIVHNITESSIQTFTSPLTAVLLFLTVSSSFPTDRLEGSPENIGLGEPEGLQPPPDKKEVRGSSVGS